MKNICKQYVNNRPNMSPLFCTDGIGHRAAYHTHDPQGEMTPAVLIQKALEGHIGSEEEK